MISKAVPPERERRLVAAKTLLTFVVLVGQALLAVDDHVTVYLAKVIVGMPDAEQWRPHYITSIFYHLVNTSLHHRIFPLQSLFFLLLLPHQPLLLRL